MAIETATSKPSKRQPKEPKVKAPKEPKAPKAPVTPKASKGNPAAKAVVWPSSVKPSLVFLPEKIRDAQAYRRSVRQAMLLSVAALGATAVIYAGAAATAISARGELAEQTTLATQLKGQIASNQQVQEYYDGFIISKQVVSDTLKSDTAHSRVLSEIQSSNTVGAQFQSIKKKLAAECPSGDPFAASVAVGCFELSGTAPDISSITTFLTGLQAKTEVLTNPLISESGSDASGSATFKMTVGYTDKAISGKGDPYIPTDAELAALNSTSDAAPTAVDQKGVTGK
jgi:hypothetical protein